VLVVQGQLVLALSSSVVLEQTEKPCAPLHFYEAFLI
jgi:hypothetical protein